MNYKLLTGPYAGEVVSSGGLLGSFNSLDYDMQSRVRQFGEDKYRLEGNEQDFPVSLDELVEEYENSWDSIETEEETTLGE